MAGDRVHDSYRSAFFIKTNSEANGSRRRSEANDSRRLLEVGQWNRRLENFAICIRVKQKRPNFIAEPEGAVAPRGIDSMSKYRAKKSRNREPQIPAEIWGFLCTRVIPRDSYYLAKEEPVSGESRSQGPDMSPDDIAAFLMEEIAVRAASFVQHAGLPEVVANIERPYKSDTVSVDR